MKKQKHISRRQFLKTSSGIVFVLGSATMISPIISCKKPRELEQELIKHRVSAWVQLTEEGDVIIYNPAAEMGQGSMTSLPMIFAEEMDADWNKVKVEFSPQVPEVYGSEGWGGRKIQLSAGSRVTKGYYKMLRRAGAQARFILLYSAAQIWGVPIEELTTESGVISHTGSNQQITYGKLTTSMIIPESLPQIEMSDLKPITEFKLIGKDLQRYDIPDKVNGKAMFSIDVQLPEMVYGVLERGDVHGAKPTLNNQDEIMAMPGIIRIVPFDYAIGIVAERLEWALKAKTALDITWSNSKATGFNSQEAYDR